jgi:hypothetical protein
LSSSGINLQLDKKMTTIRFMDINTFTTKVSEDNKVVLTMPIQKFNEEKRTVSGFATLDNLDSQRDIVDKEASLEAFKSFRGNIREMHMPKAVGRMVNFEEKTYFDPATGEDHNGIYVEVYVSKGAQDTWEKVVDGTLSGFSIGGAFNNTQMEVTKGADGQPVRNIKQYYLTELSLVDNPANQLANVFSIQKSADGTITYDGFATVEDSADEPVAEEKGLELMALEVVEDSRMEKFVGRLEEVLNKTQGGNSMTNEIETAVVEEVTEAETEEVVVDSEIAVEKAADISEVEVEVAADDVDNTEAIVMATVEKVLERLSKSGDNAVPEVVNAVEESVSSESLDTIVKSVDENNVALASAMEAISQLTKVVTEFTEFREELSTRLTALEESTAVKKSLTNHVTKRRTSDNEADFWSTTALGGTKTSA